MLQSFEIKQEKKRKEIRKVEWSDISSSLVCRERGFRFRRRQPALPSYLTDSTAREHGDVRMFALISPAE